MNFFFINPHDIRKGIEKKVNKARIEKGNEIESYDPCELEF